MRIGDWHVQSDDRTLSNAEEIVHLTPRSWAVLMYLVEHPQQLVESDDLLERFWRGPLSEESAVRKAIHEIRNALHDDPRQPIYVKTVAKKGYILVADVETDRAPDGLAIAVLPFINLSSDSDNDYFSDGISEEILTAISLRTSVSVISRSSSFQFKGLGQSVRQVGFRLGATHIVEGSVRRAGERVRVTAHLVVADSGFQLWSSSFDRPNTDVFAIQDEIANEVATAVRLHLGPTVVSGPELSGSTSETINTDAYDSYLRGTALMQSGNPLELPQAVDLLRAAVTIDPRFTGGWLNLARAYIRGTEEYVCLSTLRDALPMAESAVRRVLELDPDNGAALGLLGWMEVIGRYNFERGLELFERAIKLAPSDSLVAAQYGFILNCLGDPRAESVFQRAYQLDPLAPAVVFTYAVYLLFKGKQVEAVEMIDSLIADEQHSYVAHIQTGLLNAFVGKYQVAEMHLDKAREIVGDNFPGVLVLGYYVAINRDTPDQQLVDQQLALINDTSKERPTPLLVTMGWPDHLIEEVWERAMDARQSTVLMYACAKKPTQMSDRFWDHVQSVVAIRTFLEKPPEDFLRTVVDRANLMASQMVLTAEELDRYCGNYEGEQQGSEITIERRGTELWIIFPGSGEYYQLAPTAEGVFEYCGFYRRLEFDADVHAVYGVTQISRHSRETWKKTESW